MATTDPPSRIPVGPAHELAPAVRRKPRSPWIPVLLLALSGLVIGLAIVVPGGERQTYLDVGSSVIGGSVVGLIFAIAQYAIDRRNEENSRLADLRLILTSTNDLTGIDLARQSLAGAFLRGKNLTAAQLSAADLAGVDLQKTNLTGSDLRSAVLSKAHLDGATVDDGMLGGCDLREARARGARFERARLVQARLDGADLSDAHLEQADLSRSSMVATSLERAHLTGAWLVGLNGRWARMTGVLAEQATFALSDLTSAHLSRARLVRADLTGTRLRDATLIRANLTEVRGGGCLMAGADLTGSILRDAVLTAADLRGATLTGCDLRGADLTGVALAHVNGLDKTIADERTKWPDGWSRNGPDHAADEPIAPPRAQAFRGAQRIGVSADAAAGQIASSLVSELARQQQLSRRRTPGARVSLPLGARAPRRLAVRSARPLDALRPGTVRLTLASVVDDGRPALAATLRSPWRSTRLPVVALDDRAAPAPTVVEQLAAHVLDVLDPRDGAPWPVRAKVARAIKRREAGETDMAACSRELLAAAAGDPWGPVVNYALGALSYNQYEAGSTREAVRRFATAYSAADRIGASLDGLVVVILSGLALANCQLYHRFGDDGPKVLAMSRTAAAIAVATAEARRERVQKKGGWRSAPDLRRTAAEGLALATYAQAFAQHLTATREDAAAAIPLYERAIAALESVDVEVPAVLYNNAGFQHMTVAGHFERGPDRDSYRRAQELFKKAVKVHPELHFGWANLGNLHRLQGEWALAEICYGEALTTARQQGIAYPQGHNELAQVLVESGKAAEAEVAHRAAITLADSPSLRAKLRAEYARSLVLAGRIDDARASAEEGLAEHPGNTHCLALLADVDGDEGASA